MCHAPIRGVQVFSKHHTHLNPPLDLACHECLNVRSLVDLPNSYNSVAIQFATKEQLKGSTHMFYL